MEKNAEGRGSADECQTERRGRGQGAGTRRSSSFTTTFVGGSHHSALIQHQDTRDQRSGGTNGQAETSAQPNTARSQWPRGEIKPGARSGRHPEPMTSVGENSGHVRGRRWERPIRRSTVPRPFRVSVPGAPWARFLEQNDAGPGSTIRPRHPGEAHVGDRTNTSTLTHPSQSVQTSWLRKQTGQKMPCAQSAPLPADRGAS